MTSKRKFMTYQGIMDRILLNDIRYMQRNVRWISKPYQLQKECCLPPHNIVFEKNSNYWTIKFSDIQKSFPYKESY